MHVDRRAFLATSAAVVGGGCLGSGGSPDEEPQTRSETDAFEQHRQQYGSREPSEGDFVNRYESDDGLLEIRVGRVERGPIQYLKGDELTEATPANDLLIAIFTVIEWRGRDDYELSGAPYPVYVDGERYWPLEELPDGSEFDAIREETVEPREPRYSDAYTVSPEVLGGPGQLIYDIPKSRGLEDYFVDVSPDAPEEDRPILLRV